MAPTVLSTGVALLLFLVSCSHGQDLASYEKSKVLVSGQYELYWTYKPNSSALEMAVRVKTLGWFGLGVSADGQMSNSDLVIGWVTAGGTAMLRVSTLHSAYCCVASYNSYMYGKSPFGVNVHGAVIGESSQYCIIAVRYFSRDTSVW